MALILRHEAMKRGIPITEDGYILVTDLIKESVRDKVNLTFDIITEVLESNNKIRYGLDCHGLLIRAFQGHSMPEVVAGLEKKTPPDVLYHGTATSKKDSILCDGIQPMKRNHVHMTADRGIAVKTGARHGKPVILTINAKQMAEDGFEFFCSENNVWLIHSVAPRYICGILYP